MKGLSIDQLHVLTSIATVDGHVAEEERQVLFTIAKKFGYYEVDIAKFLENPESEADFSDLTTEERLEYMFISLSVVQADDLVYNSEIDFCKKLAGKLNLDSAVVDVYSTRSDLSKESFMNEATRYVKN